AVSQGRGSFERASRGLRPSPLGAIVPGHSSNCSAYAGRFLMHNNTPLSVCGLLLLTATGIGADDVVARAASPNVVCEVTRPNGIVAGSDKTVPNSHGNRQLSLGPFGLWSEGTVVFKPGG